METFSLGSRGPEVAALQSLLNRMGFNAGTVDGIYGTRTKAAVIRFQQAVGLPPDGVAGVRTRAALRPYRLGYREHTVAAGDTFYRLARQYNTSLAAVLAANPGVDPEQLRPGQTVIIPSADPVVLTDVPYSSVLLREDAEGLTKRYPFLKTGVVGRSANGQPIPYFTFGQGPTDVGYNGAHHANEWITAPVLMKFIEQVCRASVTGQALGGADVRDLLRRVTFWVVPMVNPDGVDLVTGQCPPDSREYRAAREMNTDLPFPDGWKANLEGTDLNLNYPAGWDRAKEIKYAQGYTRPGPRDFVGAAPLSAPESRALAEFTAARNFRLILAYHTQGEVIYWKYQNCLPAGSEQIGKRLAEASGYALEETPFASGFAGYKDWFIQQYNRPGYTVECGKGVNPLPIAQFGEIYRDNLGILLQAAAAAAENERIY